MAGNQVRIGVGVKDNATKPIKDIRSAFHALQQDGAKGFAIGVGAAVTTKAFDVMGSAIGAVTDQIGQSIQAASDLNEQMSKSGVIFGDSADEIQAFGETAAAALGLSKRAALEAASNFGAFFTGAGQSAAAAEDMSERIVTLAADLASFNNLDPTDVLQKLQSGLSGEAEPMRRLGVFLTEAKVKAKGMEMGLAGANGELSEGAKVLARYQIILDETGKAQGDFERTSDGLANQQRILNAELENAQAQLGESLLPLQLAVTKAQIAVANFVTSGVEGWQMLGDLIGRTMSDGGDAVDEATGALQNMASASKDDLVPAVTKATGATEHLTTAEDELKAALDDVTAAVDKVNAAFDIFTGAEFDAKIAAGELAQSQKDLAELLKEGPGSKGAQDIAIFEGALAEAKKTIFDLQYQMKQAEGPAALQAWLLKVQDGLAATDAKGRAAIATLLRLNSTMAASAFMASASKDDVFVPRAPARRASGGPARASRSSARKARSWSIFRAVRWSIPTPTPGRCSVPRRSST